ncbi:hypothetical protein F909_02629 [Acinetobacter sp. ANC 3929]|uniref:hypothetical protein n=1 Tax=unclassified Acinetobacter TaxID=196816 RepID=UPI0002CE1B18|nr:MULTISPECIES: hypothetical protein [unclassified Acinetobacter]ENW81338.1 hypothetical protein F909_02629 [Acinetobacter sp. ANC 3929]MCH7353817.1 hypothetical protein [Acinetobacter sp. NIPH 2023]MCH7354377.1 hypothetical protein [Acinetobacter sp. NIPH 1958]MCH7361146.1 hypothetical protein [Acinetobacter sp. NIPH 2024]
MITFRTHLYTDTYINFDPKIIGEKIHIFHGKCIDDRGTALKNIFNDQDNHIFHLVEYLPEKMQTLINKNTLDAWNSISPTINIEDFFVIDSTTLGLAELYFIIKALIASKVFNFKILYIEPESYTKDDQDDIYQLSHYPIGFKPIPGAVSDLHSDDLEYGIFFVGFDPSRMEIALEEFQMIQNKKVKIIFGSPAFQSGWELESIIPHLNILSDNRNFELNFCSAIDPSSSYELLGFYKRAAEDGKKIFIAPLGPKPTTIATALFANIYNQDVSLLYDHPVNLDDRTKGVRQWHLYSVYINEI